MVEHGPYVLNYGPLLHASPELKLAETYKDLKNHTQECYHQDGGRKEHKITWEVLWLHVRRRTATVTAESLHITDFMILSTKYQDQLTQTEADMVQLDCHAQIKFINQLIECPRLPNMN